MYLTYIIDQIHKLFIAAKKWFFLIKKVTEGSIYVKVVAYMRRCKEELQPPFKVAMPFYNYCYRHILLSLI